MDHTQLTRYLSGLLSRVNDDWVAVARELQQYLDFTGDDEFLRFVSRLSTCLYHRRLYTVSGLTYPCWFFPATEPQLRHPESILATPLVDSGSTDLLSVPEYGQLMLALTGHENPIYKDIDDNKFVLSSLIQGENLELRCGVAKYSASLATCDALKFELLYSWKNYQHDLRSSAVDPLTRLPHLKNLLESVDDPIISGKRRAPGVSVAVTVCLRRKEEDDYICLVHHRSSRRLAEERGKYHVIPAGGFEPGRIDTPDRMYSIYETVLREYGEELFSLEEPARGFDPTWYHDAAPEKWSCDEPPVRALMEILQRGDAVIRILGVAVNALELRPDILVLLLINDADWAEKWIGQLKVNWEFRKNTEADPFSDLPRCGHVPLVENPRKLLGSKQYAYLRPGEMVPQGAVALWEGMKLAYRTLRENRVGAGQRSGFAMPYGVQQASGRASSVESGEPSSDKELLRREEWLQRLEKNFEDAAGDDWDGCAVNLEGGQLLVRYEGGFPEWTKEVRDLKQLYDRVLSERIIATRDDEHNPGQAINKPRYCIECFDDLLDNPSFQWTARVRDSDYARFVVTNGMNDSWARRLDIREGLWNSMDGWVRRWGGWRGFLNSLGVNVMCSLEEDGKTYVAFTTRSDAVHSNAGLTVASVDEGLLRLPPFQNFEGGDQRSAEDPTPDVEHAAWRGLAREASVSVPDAAGPLRLLTVGRVRSLAQPCALFHLALKLTRKEVVNRFRVAQELGEFKRHGAKGRRVDPEFVQLTEEGILSFVRRKEDEGHPVATWIVYLTSLVMQSQRISGRKGGAGIVVGHGQSSVICSQGEVRAASGIGVADASETGARNQTVRLRWNVARLTEGSRERTQPFGDVQVSEAAARQLLEDRVWDLVIDEPSRKLVVPESSRNLWTLQGPLRRRQRSLIGELLKAVAIGKRELTYKSAAIRALKTGTRETDVAKRFSELNKFLDGVLSGFVENCSESRMFLLDASACSFIWFYYVEGKSLFDS